MNEITDISLWLVLLWWIWDSIIYTIISGDIICWHNYHVSTNPMRSRWLHSLDWFFTATQLTSLLAHKRHTDTDRRTTETTRNERVVSTTRQRSIFVRPSRRHAPSTTISTQPTSDACDHYRSRSRPQTNNERNEICIPATVWESRNPATNGMDERVALGY